MKRASRVLDLGASPGSWSLYLLDMLAGAGQRDRRGLNEPDDRLLARKNYHFILGDFSTAEVEQAIRASGPYDVIVSDAAPSTTGNRTLDTARSADMAHRVIALCELFLVPGGNCVLKIFQGGEERDVLARIRTLFSAAKAFKPKASRSESMETYFIGLGFVPAARG